MTILLYRWGKRAAHNRAQIMYYLAENMELRRSEFAENLSRVTGCEIAAGEKEVDLSIQRLFHWAAYCDKYGGTVQVRKLRFLLKLGPHVCIYIYSKVTCIHFPCSVLV